MKIENIRELLISFMKFKGDMFPDEIGHGYLLKEDVEEIISWSDEMVEKIFNSLISTLRKCNTENRGQNILMNTFAINDTDFCVFCINIDISKTENELTESDIDRDMFCSGCYSCGYGKRHGICGSETEPRKDEYSEILHRLYLLTENDAVESFFDYFNIYNPNFFKKALEILEKYEPIMKE